MGDMILFNKRERYKLENGKLTMPAIPTMYGNPALCYFLKTIAFEEQRGIFTLYTQ